MFRIKIYVPRKSFGNLTGKMTVSFNAVLACSRPTTSSNVMLGLVTIAPKILREENNVYTRIINRIRLTLEFLHHTYCIWVFSSLSRDIGFRRSSGISRYIGLRRSSGISRCSRFIQCFLELFYSFEVSISFSTYSFFRWIIHRSICQTYTSQFRYLEKSLKILTFCRMYYPFCCSHISICSYIIIACLIFSCSSFSKFRGFL